MKFHYRAKQGPYQYQTGEIEAANFREAVEKISGRGLTPIDVYASSQPPAHASGGRVPDLLGGGLRSFRDRIFQTDVVLFTRQLSDFLSAGVPLLKALQLILGNFQPARMRCCLNIIEASVRDGAPLSGALEMFPDIFSEMYITMVRAGELSGALDETVGRLADLLEKDRETRLKAATGLMYPAVLISVAFATVFILLTWVIPRITIIFEEMNQALPLITRLLTGISAFFAEFWWAMIGAMICAGFLGAVWQKTPEGRLKMHDLISAAPWIGSVIRELAVARFTRTLGVLLNGGIDIVPALGYAAGVVENQRIRSGLVGMSGSVAGGVPFSEAARRSGVFQGSDISILSVGEETGALSAGLFQLAAFYEKNHDRRMKMMMSLFEPCVILGLGLVIGFVVLAMLMPIFQINVMAG